MGYNDTIQTYKSLKEKQQAKKETKKQQNEVNSAVKEYKQAVETKQSKPEKTKKAMKVISEHKRLKTSKSMQAVHNLDVVVKQTNKQIKKEVNEIKKLQKKTMMPYKQLKKTHAYIKHEATANIKALKRTKNQAKRIATKAVSTLNKAQRKKLDKKINKLQKQVSTKQALTHKTNKQVAHVNQDPKHTKAISGTQKTHTQKSTTKTKNDKQKIQKTKAKETKAKSTQQKSTKTKSTKQKQTATKSKSTSSSSSGGAKQDGKLEKLTLKSADDKSTILEVQFNPNNITVTKTVPYDPQAVPGNDNEAIDFTSGRSKDMGFELFFDTTDSPSDDVITKYLSKIDKMLIINNEKHRPPIILVTWGSMSFTAVLESATYTYLLFNKSGKVVRATAKLDFKEYKEPGAKGAGGEKQSPDHTKIRVLRDGDSLQSIAHKEYEDVSKWKIIAEHNNITNPLQLQAGMQIQIPALKD